MIKAVAATAQNAMFEVTLQQPRPSSSGKTTLLATGRGDIEVNGKSVTAQVNIFTKSLPEGAKLPKTLAIQVPLNDPRPSTSGKNLIIGVLRDTVAVNKDITATAQISLYQKP